VVVLYIRHAALGATALARRTAARLLPIAEKPVALALDDAPSPSTRALLDQLHARGHRGILFVIGQKVDIPSPVLIDAVRRGFGLGNHSFSHPRFSSVDMATAEDEIVRTERVIDGVYEEAGVPRWAKWFRFPYLDGGATNGEAFQSLLQRLGFEPLAGMRPGNTTPWRYDVRSTLVTHDTRSLPVERFQRRMRVARPGDVVEFHDRPQSVDAYLPSLLDALDAARLVAVVPIPRGRSTKAAAAAPQPGQHYGHLR
jgi:peptidoglycan/xylan/chitin deacetylase (PgdA/CDA1 family)